MHQPRQAKYLAGLMHFLEHETGLAGGLRPLCASRAKLGRKPATPTLAKRCWADFIEEFRLKRSYRVV